MFPLQVLGRLVGACLRLVGMQIRGRLQSEQLLLTGLLATHTPGIVDRGLVRNRSRGQVLDSRRQGGSQCIAAVSFRIFLLCLSLKVLTDGGVFLLPLALNAVVVGILRISTLLLLLTLIHKTVNFGRRSELGLSGVLNLLVLVHFFGVARCLDLLLFNVNPSCRRRCFKVFGSEGKVE